MVAGRRSRTLRKRTVEREKTKASIGEGSLEALPTLIFDVCHAFS